MTHARNESFFNATDWIELESTSGKLVTDGGEDLYEHDDVPAEYAEDDVEYYPDGFVSGEPIPQPTTNHEVYAGEYYGDPHLQPGYDVDPEPPWGHEDTSGRPHGPPCRDCGEPTVAESFGWAPDTGQTVDYAICEDCGLGWGPVTEWVDLDETTNATGSDTDEC